MHESVGLEFDVSPSFNLIPWTKLSKSVIYVI